MTALRVAPSTSSQSTMGVPMELATVFHSRFTPPAVTLSPGVGVTLASPSKYSLSIPLPLASSAVI